MGPDDVMWGDGERPMDGSACFRRRHGSLCFCLTKILLPPSLNCDGRCEQVILTSAAVACPLRRESRRHRRRRIPRHSDLSPGSFTEIYRYVGCTEMETLGTNLSTTGRITTSFSITDENQWLTAIFAGPAS